MKKDCNFHNNFDEVHSLTEILIRSEGLYKDCVAVRYKRKKTTCEKTYTELLADSKAVAQYLLSLGLPEGHIALLGASSYEWICAYCGAMFAGKVIVPLDKELDPKGLAEQMEVADCDLLLYDKEYADVAETILSTKGENFLSHCIDEAYPEIQEAFDLPETDPEKLSAILFTSGTTGKSKGVMLTQGNIAEDINCAAGAINTIGHERDTALSVLPFNHAFEATCTIFGMIYLGIPICISRGIKYMQKEFAEYQPTIMFVVPMIAEKLFEKVLVTAEKQGKADKLRKGMKLSLLTQKVGIDISGKLLGEVRSAFGGKLRVLVCGGAPLKEGFIEKYKALGINLFQGYGLTECAPILSMNFERYHRPGSVGKVVPACEVKSVDGELWARGTTVSKGYYGNPEATAEAFEDGWFKTGDLGYVDGQNFVFITGRKKNLIILSNGENVSAEELEDKLYDIPYISEVVVRGENDSIVAEIYVDPEVHEIPERAVIDADIDKINRTLAFYKRIGSFTLRDEPFPKTTSRKIKRYTSTK